MMHLTLKSLEATGSLEVRWVGGWGDQHEDRLGREEVGYVEYVEGVWGCGEWNMKCKILI